MSIESHRIGSVARVREAPVSEPPALVHAEWARAFPWLVQGTTVRGDDPEPFDLGLFSGGRGEEEVRRNWLRLGRGTGLRRIVHARQVHGSRVCTHTRQGRGVHREPTDARRQVAETVRPSPEGRDSRPTPRLVEEGDGHVTAVEGILLAVTTADCVPVFAVDPDRRVVGVFHAGWRGAADGVLERGLDAMAGLGSIVGEVHLHLGPAICGACYEVGPEVFEALGLPAPSTPTPIDLRGILGERAIAAGVRAERVTISEHCTRCTASGLFSHRRGDAHRQVGYVGIRG